MNQIQIVWRDNAFPLGFSLILVSSLFSQTETKNNTETKTTRVNLAGRRDACLFVFREVLSQISMGFHLPTHRPMQFHVNFDD